MITGKLYRYWLLLAVSLVIIVATGGAVIWQKYSPSTPVEISLPQSDQWQGRLYINGAVASPGLYYFTGEDSVAALVQAAGGMNPNADLSVCRLYIPGVGEAQEPQKVDINRAETWLLMALPRIGETLAERIVDYRQQHGPFANIRQIVHVAGIGNSTYEQIEHMITVAD